MARRRPPPPKCACAHLYAAHEGSGRCLVWLRHRHETDDENDHSKCTRCPCAKFRVPDGPGRKKKSRQEQLNEATAAGLAVTVATAGHAPGLGFLVKKAMQPKNTPWWR